MLTGIGRRREANRWELLFPSCLLLSLSSALYWQILTESGEGNGTAIQYSCLENPRDGGTWWAAIYGVTQSQTRLKRLSRSSSRSNREQLAK